jgi:EmrB/QacA subfamily drug resistance transporter
VTLAVTPRQGPQALILAVCCTSLFLTSFDTTVMMIGLPAVGRSLHAGVSGLQWAMTAYTVALASLLMSSAALADRFGRRTVFQAGLAVFTAGSWLCSLAPSLGWLVGFRVLQGVGGSMLNPAALGIVTSVFTSPAGRARAIGTWDGVFGVSMALGPVAGGVLVGAAGWRGIFWVNIPAGLTALCLTAIIVPDSRAARPPRPDPAAQVLITIVIGALATAIIQAPGWGWRAPLTVGLLAAAAAALALLIAWERHRADPLIPFGVFGSAPFTAAAACAVTVTAALAGFLFLTTLYLQDVRGMTALRAALTLAPMPAEMALCAPLAARVIARRGSRIPAVAGGAAVTAASIILAGLTRSSPPGFLALTYSLFGLGVGLCSPVITYGVMSGMPAGKAAVASGINSSGRQLGQCLGVAVAGSVLAARVRGSSRLAGDGRMRPGGPGRRRGLRAPPGSAGARRGRGPAGQVPARAAQGTGTARQARPHDAGLDLPPPGARTRPPGPGSAHLAAGRLVVSSGPARDSRPSRSRYPEPAGVRSCERDPARSRWRRTGGGRPGSPG